MHLCTCVSEEGVNGEEVDSEVSHLLSYTLRYVSVSDLDRDFQFGFREPMYLCTCVSEEGGDGMGVSSEAPYLLSYTLRYVSVTDLVRDCQFGIREPIHLWRTPED
jgi:hypothetical protein